MKMRFYKISVVLMSLGMVLGLSACGTGTSPSSNGGQSNYLYEHVKVLSDGRSVDCVVYSAGNAGGLSCDWENAVKR